MLEQKTFSSLLGKIVEADFSDEKRTFLLIEDDLIEDIYKDNRSGFSAKKSTQAFHKMGSESVIIALKIIPAAWATYKAIKEMITEYQKIRTLQPAQQMSYVETVWTHSLQQEKIPQDTASSIAKKHAQEVLHILETKYGK